MSVKGLNKETESNEENRAPRIQDLCVGVEEESQDAGSRSWERAGTSRATGTATAVTARADQQEHKNG